MNDLRNLNILFVIFSMMTISITACVDDAPHSNPLDPVHGGQLVIEGRVLTFYQPRQALPNALITLIPGNRIVYSDQSGNFRFGQLQSGKYQLICNLDGYHIDTLSIDLANNQTPQFLLDGLPQFESISLTTHKRSRWFPLGDTYLLEAAARVSDPDGLSDIRRVLLHFPDISFSDTLQPTSDRANFDNIWQESELSVQKLHQLIGREAHFEVQDFFHQSTNSNAHYLTRIIEYTPQLVAPIDFLSITGDTLLFEWQPFILPYRFDLYIELFQISFGVPIKINEIGPVAATESNYQYIAVLESGDYFWTLKIVDEFGNSSASKEGSFTKTTN